MTWYSAYLVRLAALLDFVDFAADFADLFATAHAPHATSLLRQYW